MKLRNNVFTNSESPLVSLNIHRKPLIITTFWADSENNKMIFFFLQKKKKKKRKKIDLFLCKFSQNVKAYFLGRIWKYFKMWSVEFLPRMLSPDFCQKVHNWLLPVFHTARNLRIDKNNNGISTNQILQTYSIHIMFCGIWSVSVLFALACLSEYLG